MEVNDSAPLKLGYFLEERDQALSSWPWKLYRGVERQYFMSHIQEDDSIWDDYIDEQNDGSIQQTESLALAFRKRFLDYGLHLDMIYCEIWSTPDSLELLDETTRSYFSYLGTIQHRILTPTRERIFLGLDISLPMPQFHSAILEPGLSEVRPDLLYHLNTNGLFHDLRTAREYLHEANRMGYRDGEFCIIAVWEVT